MLQVKHPAVVDADTLRYTTRYIRGAMGYKFALGKAKKRYVKNWHPDDEPIKRHFDAWTDSDWAGDICTKKSISSFLISFGDRTFFCIEDTTGNLPFIS